MTKRLVLGVFLAVVVGVGSFFVAYQLWPNGGQTEAQPDIMAERDRLTQEEAAKPRFEGVMNGIRLYSTDGDPAAERKSACTDANPEGIAMSAVVGTPMEIIVTYLPPGAEEVAPMWPTVACGGTVASVERDWVIRDRGSNFLIIRYQGEEAIDSSASADRVSAATVGGKRAVLVKPLTPDGFGRSTVIVAEDFGLTIVSASGLSLEETIKIAEGLK
ncbi:MAG: hypothetical protein MUP14_01495 [Dehalococcoidia bacterium]|nr:hypothetical protein [Dehalococcoidia bacterium]